MVFGQGVGGKLINKICGANPFQERVWRVGWIYQKFWQFALKPSGQEKCSHPREKPSQHPPFAAVLDNSQWVRSPLRNIFLLSSPEIIRKLGRTRDLAFKSVPEWIFSFQVGIESSEDCFLFQGYLAIVFSYSFQILCVHGLGTCMYRVRFLAVLGRRAKGEAKGAHSSTSRLPSPKYTGSTH